MSLLCSSNYTCRGLYLGAMITPTTSGGNLKSYCDGERPKAKGFEVCTCRA